MTTFVGTQTDFRDVVKELVELDYDAVEAYNVAIDKLDNPEYKAKLTNFRQDHIQHIKDWNELLIKHDQKEVDGPSSKQWFTKGKVVLSDLIGDDKTILRAMQDNEKDTATAYDQANRHSGKWNDSLHLLEKGLADERRHKSWIETVI